jgi:putative transposase
LYNGALEERISYYRKFGKGLTRIDQQKSLTELRSDDLSWTQIPLNVLRSSLRKLELAYQGFFRRLKKGETPGFPRFKGANRFRSFSLQKSTKVEHKVKGSQAKVWIPKLGWVHFHEYRPIQGKLLDVSLRKEHDDRWFVCFQCDLGKAPEVSIDPTKSVGIDLGLRHFVTLSNGETIENPRFFRKSEKVLAERQRTLQRKRRGSNSRIVANRLVAKAHLWIRNQRLDFSRKLSKQLFTRFDVIFHEDLNIKGMTRSLNFGKSVNDAAWGIFLRSLAYKAEEAGKLLIGVDPRGTTQRCSGCGEHVPKGRAHRSHLCPSCGLNLDRDHNAALNIQTLGLSVVLEHTRPVKLAIGVLS